MDIKDIKQLVKLMVDNELSELEIADGQQKVHLKRPSESGQVTGLPAPVAAVPAASPAVAPPPAPAEQVVDIRSPMVGTFYAAAGPDSEPYVDVGSSITEDSVVCIVEAMKVMNEIRAECAGVVREVCVRNTQPVEFGQVLFRVKPA